MSLFFRPTIAEIDLDALGHNYRELRSRVAKEVKFLAVVKADAYGHGAIEISKELERLGADFLGVAITEEGIRLRKAGIKKPILILTGVYKEEADTLISYDLTPVIFDLEIGEILAREAKKREKRFKIHVKIDTGMGRIGILPSQTEEFFLRLKNWGNLEVEGIMSHLAVAERSDPLNREFTYQQLKTFEQEVKKINKLGINPPLKHLANSAALIEGSPFFFNLVRPGIMLYGAYPSPEFKEKVFLKPVMSLKSKIIFIKKVPPGFSISYGRSFICSKESLIATLPIGYADGYSRLLSNKGEVLLRGKKVPIVGIVCMDLLMIDVSEVEKVKVGEEVVLVGKQGKERITAEEMAEKMRTISYEFFCRIGERVPRVYLKEGERLEL